MARARNIKPGFFKNADLVELTMEARLLFIGLWTMADRSGRLEDRPKQIKMELFPADNVDVNACLDGLQVGGFLVRYEVEGKRLLQVVNFDKHQNPHRDEKPSVLPAQDGSIDAPQSKHRASTVQAPCNDDVGTVPIGLIPDSLLLIPDPCISTSLRSVDATSAEPRALPALGLQFLKAEGIDPIHAADWLKVRKVKKAPLTQTAWDSVVLEAEKAGMSAAEAVAIAAKNSWQGFKADWLKPELPRNASPPPTVQSDAAERTRQALDANACKPWAPPTPEQRAALQAARSSAKRIAA